MTLYKDKDKDRMGGGPGSEELLLQSYVEFMMDEEVPLDNIALKIDPLRTTQASSAPKMTKERSLDTMSDGNNVPTKRIVSIGDDAMTSFRLGLGFKKDIRLDAEPQSTQKPPLPVARGSLRLSTVFDDVEPTPSVLSPISEANSMSPRASIRLDMSGLESGSMSVHSMHSVHSVPSTKDSVLSTSASASTKVSE